MLFRSRHKETGYVVPSGNAQEIAKAVISFYQEDRETDWESNIRKQAAEFSWETMVERMEKCFFNI